MFKVGDEILVPMKITGFDNDCYFIDYMNGWTDALLASKFSKATLIDHNEPKNGQRVWCRNANEKWRYNKYYYVWKNPLDEGLRHIVVSDDGYSLEWDYVTTKDPFAKPTLGEIKEDLKNLKTCISMYEAKTRLDSIEAKLDKLNA